MKTEYDKKSDSKYVRIKKGKVFHTKKEQEWLLFDCAKNGDVLGVEILNASKHPVSIHTVKEKFLGCSIPKSSYGRDKSLRLTIKSPQHMKSNEFVPV